MFSMCIFLDLLHDSEPNEIIHLNPRGLGISQILRTSIISENITYFKNIAIYELKSIQPGQTKGEQNVHT